MTGVRLQARTDLREYDSRLRVVVVLFTVPILLLVGRLAYLQILQGDRYYQASLENTTRQRVIPAVRGQIYDSRGRLLAENRPSFDAYVTPELFVLGGSEALDLLRSTLSLSDEEVSQITEAIERGEDRDIRVGRDLTWAQVAQLETIHLQLPGVFIEALPHRHYPHDDLVVHLIGYMGEVQPDDLPELEALGYREGDHVGLVGLEQALEPVLKGQNGFERYVVDARGRIRDDAISDWMLGSYQRVEPIPGRNVALTIDVELQQIVREAMRDYATGAVVAVDPRDGSILAMLSKPTFNPNAWTGRLSDEEFEAARNDPDTPLYDRAIHAYFPGSTFKIVTAAAALAEGLIGPNDTLHCDGQYTYGNRVFHCNRRHGHGDIHLAEALQQSCNVFFYKLGERLGIERLVEYGHIFGFGEYPGSGLPNESPGLVPTFEWLEDNSPEGFQYGQVLNVSVGQGDTRTSPLQMAMAYTAIANGGTLFYPRLVDRIESHEGEILFQYPSRVRRELPFREDHMGEIVVGLTAAVNAAGGTVYDSRLDYMIVAGKTGTAQGTEIDSNQEEEEEEGNIPEEERTSAWFAGFAPAEDPQIVVAVFLEHGGSGGRNAAPVGLEIIDRYFREVLDYDVEITTAIARGNTDELEGLMRLNRPGHESDTFRSSDWAEPYIFGYYPDRPTYRLIRQWREQR
jgi:penicillin-binding protein 2